MAEPVRVEYKGRIAVITIDNEKKLNALTQDGYYLIAKFLREIATHDEVFITVLTGMGKFGHPLPELIAQTGGEVTPMVVLFSLSRSIKVDLLTRILRTIFLSVRILLN
jgi:hypothetical protein